MGCYALKHTLDLQACSHVSLKYVWDFVMPRVGNLTEEEFCVFSSSKYGDFSSMKYV
jgi:hypothetical protein